MICRIVLSIKTLFKFKCNNMLTVRTSLLYGPHIRCPQAYILAKILLLGYTSLLQCGIGRSPSSLLTKIDNIHQMVFQLKPVLFLIFGPLKKKLVMFVPMSRAPVLTSTYLITSSRLQNKFVKLLFDFVQEQLYPNIIDQDI